MASMFSGTRVPRLVPVFNPIAARLLRFGMPMGPNALLTVRGRKSGVMRTTPVALMQSGGKRWVIGTFGDVNWVRNLRAAGEATVSIRRRTESYRARELTLAETTTFFTQVLGPYVAGGPLARLFLRFLHASDIISDPAGAAARRPVFELLPIT